jgi:hypothetical protein
VPSIAVTDIGGERNIHCIKRLLNVAYGLRASRGAGQSWETITA